MEGVGLSALGVGGFGLGFGLRAYRLHRPSSKGIPKRAGGHA